MGAAKVIKIFLSSFRMQDLLTQHNLIYPFLFQDPKLLSLWGKVLLFRLFAGETLLLGGKCRYFCTFVPPVTSREFTGCCWDVGQDTLCPHTGLSHSLPLFQLTSIILLEQTMIKEQFLQSRNEADHLGNLSVLVLF